MSGVFVSALLRKDKNMDFKNNGFYIGTHPESNKISLIIQDKDLLCGCEFDLDNPKDKQRLKDIATLFKSYIK